ncbi:YeiH family protein [Marinilabilia rubra]|nr:putative sulfate exporter family transporter [Marinilabilia rubra]
MVLTQRKKRLILIIPLIMCLTHLFPPSLALLSGIALSMAGITDKSLTQHTNLILKIAIILMGFGMNAKQILEASGQGFLNTALSVIFVIITGLILGKILKLEKNTTILIASGTAICGGSAIAAVSPVIKAKSHQTSFALAVVFILNAIALFLFPFLGHYLGMSQETFGYWAAIAIHDTSSVVGAGAVYGSKALEIATTVKLIRALWIIPLSIAIALFQKGDKKGKIQWPWFIMLFAAAIMMSHFLPGWSETFDHLTWFGRKGMVIALFLIGSGISFKEAKEAGWKSFVVGISLWVLTGGLSLFLLMNL